MEALDDKWNDEFEAMLAEAERDIAARSPVEEAAPEADDRDALIKRLAFKQYRDYVRYQREGHELFRKLRHMRPSASRTPDPPTLLDESHFAAQLQRYAQRIDNDREADSYMAL